MPFLGYEKVHIYNVDIHETKNIVLSSGIDLIPKHDKKFYSTNQSGYT